MGKIYNLDERADEGDTTGTSVQHHQGILNLLRANDSPRDDFTRLKASVIQHGIKCYSPTATKGIPLAIK